MSRQAGPWLVFWVNGARLGCRSRIGAVPLTEHDRAEAHRLMRLSLIQRDADGTEHYEALGVTAAGRRV